MLNFEPNSVKWPFPSQKEVSVMDKSFKVSGMSCQNCAKTVEKHLKDFDQVLEAKVDLESQTARVQSDHDLDPDDLNVALEDTPYRIEKNWAYKLKKKTES